MNLISFAHSAGTAVTKQLSRQEQKTLGQFMTPPEIARAMASRACTGFEKSSVSLLDPAAGGGVLAAAVVEALLAKNAKPKQIEVVLCEIDIQLHRTLKQLAERMRAAGRNAGVKVKVSIRIVDFLMSEFACEKPQFDIVIANPPYFKISKSDPRASRHSYAVYGQPNIYGLFMAACARILKPAGRWCFITPRSWTNGPYFGATRRQILRWLHIDGIHIFESREDHFTEDEVLQEAIITWATAQAGIGDTIVVSTSQGVCDLAEATLRALPFNEVIGGNCDSVISLPTVDGSSVLKQFSATLSTHGIRVSTGPVVPFRAAEYIAETRRKGMVPLLWMQHINHMRLSWPIQKKREHIAANAKTAWMLVPNENMVIMRRFSPKEELRRVTAAPYIGGSLPGSVIGLENHTNYLYRPGGTLSPDEVRGIAAFLNSRLVDKYLRTVSGNTQINASDLRTLPFPPLSQLVAIGRALADSSTLEQADLAVEAALETQSALMIA